MLDTELAYLAGIVDADGYVTATMSTHAGRLYFGAQVGILHNPRALPEPIPYRGRLGLWDFPDDLLPEEARP